MHEIRERNIEKKNIGIFTRQESTTSAATFNNNKGEIRNFESNITREIIQKRMNLIMYSLGIATIVSVGKLHRHLVLLN